MGIQDHIAVFDHDGSLEQKIKRIGELVNGHERQLATEFWDRFIELNPSLKAVSYTHLTLPTKVLVCCWGGGGGG